MAREGFNIQSKVVDLMRHGAWNWPLSWLAKAPNLSLITALNFDNSHDRIQWRDANGKMADFSVKLAWEALRLRGDKVSWSNIVWFAHCIPRHAFHLWLVIRRSLKTQDMLRPWDVEPSTNLSTLRWFQNLGGQHSVHAIVGKLLFAASSYFLWCERNDRLFNGTRRTPKEIKDQIVVTIRLKLFSFRFKNTTRVKRMLALWKMPLNFRLYRH
ncbi:hypothetical protein Tco_0697471 [Tanacetum coccineum]